MTLMKVTQMNQENSICRLRIILHDAFLLQNSTSLQIHSNMYARPVNMLDEQKIRNRNSRT